MESSEAAYKTGVRVGGLCSSCAWWVVMVDCSWSLVAQAVLQLTMELRLALNSDPPAFTSQVLGLHVCTTMPGIHYNLDE